MNDILFVVSVVGGGLALAVAAGLFLAARFGERSATRRRTIAMGTIVVAVVLAVAWVLLAGKGNCC